MDIWVQIPVSAYFSNYEIFISEFKLISLYKRLFQMDANRGKVFGLVIIVLMLIVFTAGYVMFYSGENVAGQAIFITTGEEITLPQRTSIPFEFQIPINSPIYCFDEGAYTVVYENKLVEDLMGVYEYKTTGSRTSLSSKYDVKDYNWIIRKCVDGKWQEFQRETDKNSGLINIENERCYPYGAHASDVISVKSKYVGDLYEYKFEIESNGGPYICKKNSNGNYIWQKGGLGPELIDICREASDVGGNGVYCNPNPALTININDGTYFTLGAKGDYYDNNYDPAIIEKDYRGICWNGLSFVNANGYPRVNSKGDFEYIGDFEMGGYACGLPMVELDKVHRSYTYWDKNSIILKFMPDVIQTHAGSYKFSSSNDVINKVPNEYYIKVDDEFKKLNKEFELKYDTTDTGKLVYGGRAPISKLEYNLPLSYFTTTIKEELEVLELPEEKEIEEIPDMDFNIALLEVQEDILGPCGIMNSNEKICVGNKIYQCKEEIQTDNKGIINRTGEDFNESEPIKDRTNVAGQAFQTIDTSSISTTDTSGISTSADSSAINSEGYSWIKITECTKACFVGQCVEQDNVEDLCEVSTTEKSECTVEDCKELSGEDIFGLCEDIKEDLCKSSGTTTVTETTYDINNDDKIDGQDAYIIYKIRSANLDDSCGGNGQLTCIYGNLKVCDNGVNRVNYPQPLVCGGAE
jgi:hypothetical protein